MLIGMTRWELTRTQILQDRYKKYYVLHVITNAEGRMEDKDLAPGGHSPAVLWLR